MKTKGQRNRDRRAVQRLINGQIGAPGLAWGSAPGGGMTIAIHDGNGTDGQFSGLVFSSEQLRTFADNFVRSLTNAEHVPAIRDLIAHGERQARAIAQGWRERAAELMDEVLTLRAELERAKAERVPPYSPATALVLAGGKERAA